VRTRLLDPIEDIENGLENFSNALKWDPRKFHLLLNQLGFVNDEDVQSPRLSIIIIRESRNNGLPFWLPTGGSFGHQWHRNHDHDVEEKSSQVLIH
jgi:hypothetical protein